MKPLATSPMEKNTLSMLQLPKTQVRSCFSSSLSPTHFPDSLRVLLAIPLRFISLLSPSDRLQRKCTQPPPWRCGLQDFTSHVHLPASPRGHLAASHSCALTLQNVRHPGRGTSPRTAQPPPRQQPLQGQGTRPTEFPAALAAEQLWKITAVLKSPPIWEPVGRWKTTCSQIPEKGREKGHGQELHYLARGRRQDEPIHGAGGGRHESGYRHRTKEDRRNGIGWMVQHSQNYRKSILRFQLSLGHLF